MAKIDAYFNQRLATDQACKRPSPAARSATELPQLLRPAPSIAFSYGSHDEWNIARIINERRRGSADYGVANQLGIVFDGAAAAPGAAEAPIASGDVGRCIN